MVRSKAGKPGSMTYPINQVRQDWDCTGEGGGDGKGEPDRRDVYGLGSVRLMIN